MIELSVLGQGAVLPAGLGVTPLIDSSEWPKTLLSRLNSDESPWTVSRVNPELLKRWQSETRFRRASPISLFMAEVASQALNDSSNISRERIGMVVGHFNGGIHYSRRFYQGIVEQGAKFASPALFPETVFNSPASHLVATLKLGGPVYSLMGDETVWINAISTAALWLELDQVDAVLVIGAEELDPIVIEAYHRAGWFRRGFCPAEGAGALLLGKAALEPSLKISGWKDGYLHRTMIEAKNAHKKLDQSLGSIPRALSPWHPWASSVFPSDPFMKNHAFSASAAWQTIRALSQVSGSKALPIIGCNHQSGALILSSNLQNLVENKRVLSQILGVFLRPKKTEEGIDRLPAITIGFSGNFGPRLIFALGPKLFAFHLGGGPIGGFEFKGHLEIFFENDLSGLVMNDAELNS